MREGKEQKLLALNIGAPSWDAWQRPESLSQLDTDKLLDFDPKTDTASILGNRWLCEGGSLLLVGNSGIGKSTFAMQAAVTWSYGLPFFGIKPRRRLKIMVIQAENDDGDIGEMVQGVVAGLELDKNNAELRAHLRANMVIIRESAATGVAFVATARALILAHKPDLVFADPLMAYIGGDVSKQEVCSEFLRNHLNPVLQETKVGWIWLHHAGKPAKKENKAAGAWSDIDADYLGIGSSDLTNWARAIAVLVRRDDEDDVFRLWLRKRGKRAGMVNSKGDPCESVYLKHAKTGMSWLETECEEEEQAYKPPEKTSKDKSKFDTIMAQLKEPKTYAEILKVIESTFGCCNRTAISKWNKIKGGVQATDASPTTYYISDF